MYPTFVKLAFVSVFCLLAGCVVGQAPGRGQVLHIQEPTTGGWYWLYLPEDYVRSRDRRLVTDRKWPLVVSFHGMKPFDNAYPQVREWQQEADRYGFVICAPELASPDLVSQFPLRTVHPGVRYDERLTIAAMDDITRRVDIDPAAVLSTSWSSGGYVAHYMANKHPERFTCVGVRQSNFSAAVLDVQRISRYRGNKIGIFYTENDFAICRKESQEAARWYSQHGFDVTFAVFKDLGHERRPGAAAAFFAQTCGAKAKTPPTEIGAMQVKDIPIVALARASASAMPPTAASRDGSLPHTSGSPRVSVLPPLAEASSPVPKRTGSRKHRGRPVRRSPPVPTGSTATRTGSTAASAALEASRTEPTPFSQVQRYTANPIKVRISSTIGIAPLLVSFSVIVPRDLRRGAYYLWTDNGEPISNGMNGQKYLTEPGRHVLEILMTTAAGKQHRASKTVTVLRRISNDASG